MQGFLLLSDSASTDVATGKINLLGAGWSVTGPAVPMSAVAGFIRIPWEEVGEKICFSVRLIDDEGRPVRPSPDDDGMLSFDGEISPDVTGLEPVAGRVPLTFSFAIPIPPLPLEGGRVYEWVLDAAGDRVASVQFVVRPPVSSP
ncbi:hypothetical protein E1286_39385 [Nonomuraea terrae]|uniref:Uncharacterized protein n=2 Tax=Nonomuraea TaxID=83681 RepID=A0A2W2FQF7_9ACTN|nr:MULTISPECIES: hypothetical protein [Nonomuraea]PZG17304.1 hypothetical protein C1J01_18440 [Nonomuraea aridisoli]TDD35583.1 hypothetical protein E1286_39385 [Nonomuraea terrae]